MAAKQLSFTDFAIATATKKPSAPSYARPSLVTSKPTAPVRRDTALSEWLCIYLPQLATDTFTHDSSAPELLVVYNNDGAKPTVYEAASEATQHGIVPGMPLSTAYSLHAGIDVRQREPLKEQQQLETLASLLYQFSSQISLQPPNKVLLEADGSYSLFGGKKNMLSQVATLLKQQSYQAAFAVANTPKAAEWLVETAGSDETLPLHSQINQLPLTVLRPLKVSKKLQQLGCRSLADVLRLPRSGLARRFGPDLLMQLDTALGNRPDPRIAYRPPLLFDEKLELASELSNLEQLWPGVLSLLKQLTRFLREADRCTRWIQLSLIHNTEHQSTIDLKLLRAANDHERLALLLHNQLERLQIPAPVRELRLQLKQIQASRPATADALNSHNSDAESWLETLERIQLRIGAHRVHGMVINNTNQPEKAWKSTAINFSNELQPAKKQRPYWLMQTPRKLNHDRAKERLLNRLPERIAGNWWESSHSKTRDYFIAQQESGEKSWIYHSHDGWFQHGTFS